MACAAVGCRGSQADELACRGAGQDGAVTPNGARPRSRRPFTPRAPGPDDEPGAGRSRPIGCVAGSARWSCSAPWSAWATVSIASCSRAVSPWSYDLQLQARATKDTDIIVITAAGVSIVDALRDALAEPDPDFAFRLANVRGIGDTPAQAMDAKKMTYKNKAWARRFGLRPRRRKQAPQSPSPSVRSASRGSVSTDPSRAVLPVAALPDGDQAARRHRAVPRPRETIASATSSTCCRSASLNPIDRGRVAEACRQIFAERAKHSWPPRLTVERNVARSKTAPWPSVKAFADPRTLLAQAVERRSGRLIHELAAS